MDDDSIRTMTAGVGTFVERTVHAPAVSAISRRRNERRVKLVAVLSVSIVAAIGLVAAGADDTTDVATRPPSPGDHQPSAASGCGPMVSGVNVSVPEAAPNDGGWTATREGQWLREQVEASRREVLDVGSAFVLGTGIDGTAMLWFGRESDAVGMDFQMVDGVLEATPAPPVGDHNPGPRAALVQAIDAGGVRLFLVTQPRSAHETSNFPSIPRPSPCLAPVEELRAILGEIAEAADADPYDGPEPDNSGVFAIDADVGMSSTDPGDSHLFSAIAAAGVDLPGRMGTQPTLDSAGGHPMYSVVPPVELDPNGGVAGDFAANHLRMLAGGLDVLVVADRVGEEEIATARAIVVALNSRPFLGRPAGA